MKMRPLAPREALETRQAIVLSCMPPRYQQERNAENEEANRRSLQDADHVRLNEVARVGSEREHDASDEARKEEEAQQAVEAVEDAADDSPHCGPHAPLVTRRREQGV